MSIKHILEIVSLIDEFSRPPLQATYCAFYFSFGTFAFNNSKLVTGTGTAVQASDAPVGVNSCLTLVIDSLGDAELALIDTATDPEALMHVEGVLKAFESHGAFCADALGDLLFLILVRMKELLQPETGRVICPMFPGIR
jgi:hypothetical protein